MLTVAQQNRIEQLAGDLSRQGYNGGSTIVYRDPARVGLSLAVLANRAFRAGYKASIGEKLDWCVIATRDPEDNRQIRAQVIALQQALTNSSPR